MKCNEGKKLILNNITYCNDKKLYISDNSKFCFSIHSYNSFTEFKFSVPILDFIKSSIQKNRVLFISSAGLIFMEDTSGSKIIIERITDSYLSISDNTVDLSLTYMEDFQFNTSLSRKSELSGLGTVYSGKYSLTDLKLLLRDYGVLKFAVLNEDLYDENKVRDTAYIMKIADVNPVIKTSFPVNADSSGGVKYKNGELFSDGKSVYIDIASSGSSKLLDERFNFYKTAGITAVVYSHRLTKMKCCKGNLLLKTNEKYSDYDNPGEVFHDAFEIRKKTADGHGIKFLSDFSIASSSHRETAVLNQGDGSDLLSDIKLGMMKGFCDFVIIFDGKERNFFREIFMIFLSSAYSFPDYKLYRYLTGSKRLFFLDIIKLREDLSEYLKNFLKYSSVKDFIKDDGKNGYYIGDNLFAGIAEKFFLNKKFTIPEGEYFSYFRKSIVSGNDSVKPNFRPYELFIKKGSVIPAGSTIILYPDENSNDMKCEISGLSYSYENRVVKIDVKEKSYKNILLVTKRNDIDKIILNSEISLASKKADSNYIKINIL